MLSFYWRKPWQAMILFWMQSFCFSFQNTRHKMFYNNNNIKKTCPTTHFYSLSLVGLQCKPLHHHATKENLYFTSKDKEI